MLIYDTIIQRRINWVLLFFLMALAALVVRLFMLQIIYHREYAELASRQHRLIQEITPERGAILARDKTGLLVPLALNKVYKTVVASPKDIKNEKETTALLTKILNIQESEVLEKLSKEKDPYEIILKKVDQEKADKIKDLKIAGLHLEEERIRNYPHDTLAAHLLGFVSKEKDKEEGKYGLERFYEKDLAGRRGTLEGMKDASGFWIALGRRIIHPPRNGSRLLLSLDYNIQLKTEEILTKTQEKWQASSALALVIDPQTGQVLGLASIPIFNPNDFSKEKNFSTFLNPAVEARYEWGSVLKPLVMAAGLQEGLIKPDTTYEDPGEIKIGGYTIRNFDGKSYKRQTMTQILEKSLNTGAVYVAKLLGHKKHYEYLKRFGLGEKTSVDLPGEVGGDLSNLKAGREIDFATASFGQGIAVTPIQLAMALGVLANEGKLIKPYVVDKIIDDSGNEIKKELTLIRQVISKETADTLTKMLVSAVRNGFENKAGIKGYFVAGKTGTAQIPRKDGRGYSDQVIHTFVGYAPAFDPRFLILLQLNEPKGNRFAANTLTPAFHDLAEYILNYYEVPPDEK